MERERERRRVGEGGRREEMKGGGARSDRAYEGKEGMRGESVAGTMSLTKPGSLCFLLYPS